MLKKIIFFIAVTMILGGCASVYKEGLIVDRQLQESKLIPIATSSSNVINYASQLYVKEPISKGNDYITVDKDISESPDKDFLETEFFKIYCAEKKGTMYNWSAPRNVDAFSSIRGVSKQFYTCENSNKISSALLYEWYSRDSQQFPYEVNKTFATGEYTYNLIEKSKLTGFRSENAIITFPSNRIFDPDSKSQFVDDKYSVIFDYRNQTKEPVEINLLTSSISINGVKYDLSYDKNRNGSEYVRWTFYNNNEAHKVFVGEGGSKSGKLRFNPGQRLYGELTFKIPGLTKISEEDIKTLVFQLDSITCEKFSKISYYESGKNVYK